MIQTRTVSDAYVPNTDPAQFVYLRYRNSDGETSKRTILVLAYDEENELIHGLDLEYFSDQNLINTVNEIAEESQEDQDEYDLEEGVTEVPDILDREIESWYETHYSAGRYEDNPYRTFREDRIDISKEAEVTIQ